jgi:hypothetical protein
MGLTGAEAVRFNAAHPVRNQLKPVAAVGTGCGSGITVRA